MRAAGRIHLALLSSGHESTIFVTDEPSLPQSFRVGTKKGKIRRRLSKDDLWGDIVSSNKTYRSLASEKTSMLRVLNDWKPDFVMLHWVSRNTANVAQLGEILSSFPSGWFLHDMWPFLGAEHYGSEDEDAIWRVNSLKKGRPRGFFERLEAKMLDLKWSAYPKQGIFFTPNEWLQALAAQSMLMGSWRGFELPYPINQDDFFPEDPIACRKQLGLPQDKKIILFGSVGGSKDCRKGWPLLEEAFSLLQNKRDDWIAVSFGGAVKQTKKLKLPIIEFGRVADNGLLRLLMSASDVLAVPSTQDNSPLVILEAAACGTPSVGFESTGVRYSIEHLSTGFLASPLSTNSLSEGLDWAISLSALEYDAIREQCIFRSTKHNGPATFSKRWQTLGLG